MLDALEQSSDGGGWAQLGTFESYLTKLQPDSDSRLCGFMCAQSNAGQSTAF